LGILSSSLFRTHSLARFRDSSGTSRRTGGRCRWRGLLQVSVKAWNCAWLTPPLVPQKKGPSRTGTVVAGVGVKGRVEVDEIDTRIGKFLPIRKPFQIVAEVQPIH
ncbi:MAG: hypothetical protein ACJ8LM_13930, partial [Candidatus Udaeobacter sp.]